ncbi:LOW QUALITY PROTEIN: uncharacterized protein ACNS7B_011773 [Menidia menidia]
MELRPFRIKDAGNGKGPGVTKRTGLARGKRTGGDRGDLGDRTGPGEEDRGDRGDRGDRTGPGEEDRGDRGDRTLPVEEDKEDCLGPVEKDRGNQGDHLSLGVEYRGDRTGPVEEDRGAPSGSGERGPGGDHLSPGEEDRGNRGDRTGPGVRRTGGDRTGPVEEDRGDRTGPVEQDRAGPCGPCRRELCPEPRGCRAGLVPDACGCCPECGSREGQPCHPGGGGGELGLCGTGLRCRAEGGGEEGGGGGGGGEGGEGACVCEQQEPLCGSDGATYRNECQLREAAASRPGLRSRGTGPCSTVPIIQVPPLSRVGGVGSSPSFLCEVFASPLASVEWTKEGGGGVVLPGDDPHISVQSRGGPLRFELSSWLQIEGAEPADSGTYRCTARNGRGASTATATLAVLKPEELSSLLSSDIDQPMDSDYELDSY